MGWVCAICAMILCLWHEKSDLLTRIYVLYIFFYWKKKQSVPKFKSKNDKISTTFQSVGTNSTGELRTHRNIVCLFLLFRNVCVLIIWKYGSWFERNLKKNTNGWAEHRNVSRIVIQKWLAGFFPPLFLPPPTSSLARFAFSAIAFHISVGWRWKSD